MSRTFGNNDFRIDVKVGDVIDLRGSTIVGNPGREKLLIIVRAKYSQYKIDIFAPISCSEMIIARVTKILRVSHLSAKSKWGCYVYTHVDVELENAFGCEPSLKAENSLMESHAKREKKVKGEWHTGTWKRPEFTTGDVNNGKKKE